jgi:hypothetical protein
MEAPTSEKARDQFFPDVAANGQKERLVGTRWPFGQFMISLERPRGAP